MSKIQLVFVNCAVSTNDVTALGVSSDGRRVFVASLDTTAKLIDFETGNVIAEIGKKPKPISLSRLRS